MMPLSANFSGDAPLHMLGMGEFLTALAAKTPTPGGGAVAGLTAATAAALASMVVSYSIGKKSLSAHEPALRDHAAALERERAIFLELADADAVAYGRVNALMKLPETDPKRAAELAEATRESVRVPQMLQAACAESLRRFQQLTAIMNRNLRSDLAIAAVLADAASRACVWNISVSCGDLADAAEIKAGADRLAAQCAILRSEVEAACV
jgi:methenyltetrahydrofolate cyclohydrolase